MKKTLNWTEPAKPKEGVSSYDHVMCDTPLGRIMIEWKSWKDSPGYDVQLENDWIGCEYSLEDAKQVAIAHLQKKMMELLGFFGIIELPEETAKEPLFKIESLEPSKIPTPDKGLVTIFADSTNDDILSAKFDSGVVIPFNKEDNADS